MLSVVIHHINPTMQSLANDQRVYWLVSYNPEGQDNWLSTYLITELVEYLPHHRTG